MLHTELQSKKLHICIVTNEFPGLTETFITTKVLELHKRGHKITVIKNQHSTLINASHVALIKQANIEVLSAVGLSVSSMAKAAVESPSSVLKSIGRSNAKFKKTYRQKLQQSLLQRHAYDVIHFEFSGLAVLYMDTIKELNSKTVVSCRGTAEKVKPISQPGRRQQLQQIFSLVDGIHCVSADMAATIQPYCLQPQKMFINRPSIDAGVFKKYKPYAVANKHLQILTIGRFTFQKGYLIGLMAIRELKMKGITFTWKIVGDGPQHEEILYHIHALQLHDCVELLGKRNRDEIIALYNEADVFLLPSVYEGIANVCLEAMAMELPVVTTKSGGMEEVIEHGKDGLLCEVYDVNSIATQLYLICNDGEKRKAMGVHAREKVLDQFTLARQADVFEEEYYKLVNNAT